jgi:MurNAc alpha-1-phosphate uridylyltransferase
MAAAGLSTIVVNLGHLGDQIRRALGDGSRYGVTIDYSEEGDRPLETGGGIRHALPLLGEKPFLVVNADVWTDYPLPPPPPAPTDLAHLVLVANPPHHPQGDFHLRQGRVVAADGPRLTFSGLAVYRPALFRELTPGRFALAPILREAARGGQVSGERFTGRWLDVGTPERLRALSSPAPR